MKSAGLVGCRIGRFADGQRLSSLGTLKAIRIRHPKGRASRTGREKEDGSPDAACLRLLRRGCIGGSGLRICEEDDETIDS